MIRICNNHVGFGDFIQMSIIDDDIDANFFIDCGSNSHSETHKQKLHQYQNGYSFILSHFHDDHYNIMLDSNYPIGTFYIRMPRIIGCYIDYIAVACLKIICSDDEYRNTSAWFIVNIVEQITQHFTYRKIHFFKDGDLLWKQGKYSIRSIPSCSTSDSNTIDEYISYFEEHCAGLKDVINKLSFDYWSFINNQNNQLRSINEEIKQLLWYRSHISCIVSERIINDINNLYDKVVNNSSAVLGVYENSLLKCLFLGDIDVRNQKKIYDSVGSPQLLKIAHHGTENYNSYEMLTKFKPKHIILTYGEKHIRNDNILAPYFESLYSSATENDSDLFEV